MSRNSRATRQSRGSRKRRPLTGLGSPSFDTADDFASTHPQSRTGPLPPDLDPESIEEDFIPSILVSHERVTDAGDNSDPGVPLGVKFARRYTTPPPLEPSKSGKYKKGAPGSPAVASMAVDAKTQKDGDSPLKSLSWSETTVAQVDDRCIQIPVDDFVGLIPGKDLTDAQKQSLKTFRGIDIKKLSDNAESKKYSPLCDIFNKVEELADSRYRWKVVANHCESADVDHKPDLARYPIDVPAAEEAYTRDINKDDPNIGRCAWAWMNSYVEVKNAESKSPFFFARNKDANGRQKFLRQGEGGKKARGQFIKYATEAMLRQHRTHYYSVYLAEMSVRIFRWDRVGCIVSEPIDLKNHPKDFLNILYRLATSVKECGVDETVQLATEAEIALVESYDPGDNQSLRDYRDLMLGDQLGYPIYKVACPSVSVDGSDPQGAEKTYLIGRYAFGHYSPVGRCTRGYAAFDVENKHFVWLKDQWRCVARPHTELDAYVRLHKHKVPNIATPVAGGDIDGHRTLSQDYMTHLADEWRPSQRVLTRLVTKEVGKLLETYKDSVELLHICLHAFLAHKRAWENANILHRDVSVGNIMINCETGKGFLNDWDLCKYREDMVVKRPASEPSGISGTWAFKSALALRYPRKPPELADDLESFIHVITFFGYRFHHHVLSPEPANDSEAARITANVNNPELMGLITLLFYQQKLVGNGYYQGGALKYTMILHGQLPVAFQPLENGRRSLIETFLLHAYKLLQEHYWSLDESEFEEYKAQAGDCAAPDELDVPIARGAVRVPVVAGPAPGDDMDVDILFGDVDRIGYVDRRKGVFWKKAIQEKPTCPVENPQPVLADHNDMSTLFVSLFKDEDGNTLDLNDLRGDKRFDQFLNWKMIAYLRKKGKTGQRQDNLSGDDSGTKRKRDIGDSGDDDEAATPPKRHAITRTDGPRTRAFAKVQTKTTTEQEEAVLGQEPTTRQSTTRRRGTARTTVLAAEPAPTQKASKSRSRKAAQKPSETRARAKKAVKSQPTKTATKASASRKAQTVRKPSSPRRPTAIKADAAGNSRSTKFKALPPPAPGARRSQRLASKP